MANMLIIYGSTTGNTEMVAGTIKEQLTSHNPVLQDVSDTSPEDLTKYDVLVLGASTWDEGLLQQDFRDFVTGLNVDLSGKKLAIFGLGDKNYTNFCESASILETVFVKLGGEKIIESMKIDGFPDEEESVKKIKQWCVNLQAKL
jgi:flavodoxin I